MTKSSRGGTKPGEPGADEAGPSPELAERFLELEATVDEAVRTIGELRQDMRRLAARLDEANRARSEAVKRIDDLIDKIDGLL
jgi:uncharacterized coiled-coil DUF342 family protein